MEVGISVQLNCQIYRLQTLDAVLRRCCAQLPPHDSAMKSVGNFSNHEIRRREPHPLAEPGSEHCDSLVRVLFLYKPLEHDTGVYNYEGFLGLSHPSISLSRISRPSRM